MESNKLLNYVFGILGGCIGAAVGAYVFSLLVGQGFYAIALPGALLGLGCGLASRIKSMGLGIVCGIASLALGLSMEWRYFPFNADTSFSYFIAHLSDLKPASLVMIAIGGVFGLWFGTGRESLRQVSHPTG